ncbi:hypothetical protein HDC33_002285 [Sporosarcina sp. JAI121]|nr:hypothetical protein [Sporosarcina sp. JAI121]
MYKLSVGGEADLNGFFLSINIVIRKKPKTSAPIEDGPIVSGLLVI